VFSAPIHFGFLSELLRGTGRISIPCKEGKQWPDIEMTWTTTEIFIPGNNKRDEKQPGGTMIQPAVDDEFWKINAGPTTAAGTANALNINMTSRVIAAKAIVFVTRVSAARYMIAAAMFPGAVCVVTTVQTVPAFESATL
jgi:hypothetical protein